MSTVWLLQDDSDYYGPDFHAVFSNEAAAREYMEAWSGEPVFWQLDEVPLYETAPRVFTLHTIVANRANTSHAWPDQGRAYSRKYSTVDYGTSKYPEVISTPHLVRVEALDEDEAKRLFADEMRRVTGEQA